MIVLMLLGACSEPQGPAAITLDEVAESYVRLVLALGERDPGFVDAYYGPATWRDEEKSRGRTLKVVQADAEDLRQRVAEAVADDSDPLIELRRRYLATQLRAVATRAEMVAGKGFSFDEETRLLYDAVAPRHGAEHFQSVLAEIDSLLPGEESLAQRVEAFRAGFEIPRDRLEEVMRAAIEECKRRTQQHVPLPDGESFTLELVNDKPWGGYNWYQGNSVSLIQINTDLPVYIDRAVDLGCHEGYPGHHTYNALLESELVSKRGWVEFSIYALFSPQSLMAEGTGNYGIRMAFPGDERSRFEREVLFPLAGLDESQADTYYRLFDLLGELENAGNEAARKYLDGEIDRDAAVRWLVDYQLRSPESAEKSVQFFEAYRGYVINYNLGQDMVADYVERHGDDPGVRWRVFRELLSTPSLPSDLLEKGDDQTN